MFMQPPIFSGNGYTVLEINLEWIRSKRSKEEFYQWSQFINDFKNEVKELEFGMNRTFNTECLTYSTIFKKDSYANPFNERALRLLQEYDYMEETVKTLQEEHDAIEAARPEPVIPEIKFDENGDEIPPKPKKKKVLREEEAQRRADIGRYQDLLNAQHNLECLKLKVKNIINAFSLRVEHN
eukprot:Tbor_TRINITY_DN6113_c2_g1::TRINITY_DN6113_c2_g1_i1::g.22737::m.22737